MYKCHSNGSCSAENNVCCLEVRNAVASSCSYNIVWTLHECAANQDEREPGVKERVMDGISCRNSAHMLSILGAWGTYTDSCIMQHPNSRKRKSKIRECHQHNFAKLLER
eukprot:scaffold128404_cov19-Tisochrysis_lutea.AAC.1